MLKSVWRKAKRAFAPAAVAAATGVLYLNRAFVKQQAVKVATSTAGLALMNPGTALTMLVVCTDPLVIRITSNLILLFWKGTWSLVHRYTETESEIHTLCFQDESIVTRASHE